MQIGICNSATDVSLHLAAKYVTAVLNICKRKHLQIRVGQAAIKQLISLKKPK
jgi:hypothetical protein